MTTHYFAKDGNYGDAKELVIIDTSDWTEDEWSDIDFAIDSNRPSIALSLSSTSHKVSKGQLKLPIQF